MAGSVLNTTAVLRLNFSAKPNISASISAITQSRKNVISNPTDTCLRNKNRRVHHK